MFKSLFKLPLILMCLFFASSSFAVPRTSFDIVFDFDWTLFYPVDKNGDTETVNLIEGRFRMADGVIPVILKLHQQGHRISAFSGGSAARNQALAELITRKLHESGAPEFSFYKILSFEDLSPRFEAAADARFSDRWLKDLRKINADLGQVILIDDIAKFTYYGQEKNVYWLDKTYNFYAQFDPTQKQSFDPPSEAAWRKERNKIPLFFENFQKAQKNFSASEILPALQDLSQGKSLCPRVF